MDEKMASGDTVDPTKSRKRDASCGEEEETGMSSLAPDHVSMILLSLTSLADVSRLAAVSRTFRAAAESDAVWERWLPPDYREILQRAVEPVRFASKKDLFHRLSTDPVLIEGGRKSFGLERSTGKKCYMLSARDITIVWSHAAQHWRWVSLPPEESRFSEVARLVTVSWVEIRGRMNMAELSPLTTYSAFLVFKLTPNAYGFNGTPLETRLSVAGLPPTTCIVYLQETRGRLQPPTPWKLQQLLPRTPQARSDGWMEIALGEFFTSRGDQEEMVEMGMYETRILMVKSGLMVQGIELRPGAEG